MTELQQETEDRIFQAAEKIFVDKGMSGARMQEIADEANINKSLLHYYYRSKDKLFSAVLKSTFKKFLPKTIKVLTEDISLFEKIEKFTYSYIELVIKHPSIPLFVIYELNRNPKGILDTMVSTIGSLENNPIDGFINSVEKEIENGTIIEINPKQLFVNIISMCIFPVAGRAVIEKLAFNGNTEEYDSFLVARKTEVSKFVINSIKK